MKKCTKLTEGIFTLHMKVISLWLQIYVSPSRDSDEIRYFWSPVPIATRFVRIRASKLLLIGHNAKFCLRFELYGCLPPKREFVLLINL